MLSGRGGGDFGVFEDPGVFVEEEDGVVSDGEGGIDVAIGTVADHPAGVRGELMAGDDCAVGGGVLFGDDLDSGEVRGEAGAGELVGLFRVVALGHENQVVAGCQFGQRVGYRGKQFDLLLSNGTGEAEDALGFFLGNDIGAEALKTGDQRAREAGEAVTVSEDGFPFDGVKGLTYLGGGVGVVVEIADEGGDGPLKVNVVFPQGVIGVDEKGLAGSESGHDFMVGAAGKGLQEGRICGSGSV